MTRNTGQSYEEVMYPISYQTGRTGELEDNWKMGGFFFKCEETKVSRLSDQNLSGFPVQESRW